VTDVFISYSRKDIAFARLIRQALQQSQIDTWIDWERIPIGARWWQEICEAIQKASVFMFIISKASIGSSVCKDEINEALKNHKRILPILVDELQPAAIKAFMPDLPQFNWIIFERDHSFHLEEYPSASAENMEDCQVAVPKLPQFNDALVKLSKAIHTDWDWVKYHTQLQVDALLWKSRNESPGYLLPEGKLVEAETWLAHAENKDPQPTALQVEYVRQSKHRKLQNVREWYLMDENTSHYAPDFECVCVNCGYSYTFTPSEHLPIPQECPSCGYIGAGKFNR
jgi:hypothetical protein